VQVRKPGASGLVYLPRLLLDRARELAGKSSLIPSHRNYRQRLRTSWSDLACSAVSRAKGELEPEYPAAAEQPPNAKASGIQVLEDFAPRLRSYRLS
jgi:hypothetical protein